MQSLSKLFFQISEVTIRSLEDWYAAEAEAGDLRRRRASSSDGSDEETKIEDKGEHCSQSVSMEKDVVSEDDETIEETEEPVLIKRNHETQRRIQTLLVALLHGATSLALNVYNDKVPSALHCVNFNEYQMFFFLPQV